MDDKKPPLIHRDDIPMDVAEDLVSHLKELYGNDITVQFAGDSNTEMPQDMIEAHTKMNEHFRKCFVEGLCHICGARFPGAWPPEDGDDWSLQGWAYYTSDSEDQVPLLVCPDCEEADSDGQPRPVNIPT